MSQRIIYWFRNDLRLHDNEGFYAAVNASDEVIPVYVFDPRQFAKTRFGFRRASPLRARFLLETVVALRNKFRQNGGDLLIRVGDPEKIIAELAADFGASYVYASKEIAPDETRVESSLSKKLKVKNIDIKLFWMNTLVAISKLPFPISKLPSRFEGFYEVMQSQLELDALLPLPAPIRLPADYVAGTFPSLHALGIDTEEIEKTERKHIETGGEETAIQNLKKLIDQYESNNDQPQSADVLMEAQLSKWISAGCLSPRRILQAAVSSPARPAILHALLRRDYFHWTLLRYGARLFKPSGINHDLIRTWHNDLHAFEKYRNALTENQEMNRLITTLNETGYLTFEERIAAAGYLANDLGLNWTWGAAYFESLLIDYNVSNSWCNWNYVAGVAGGEPKIIH